MDPFDLTLCPLFKILIKGKNISSVIDQVTIDSRLISSKNALFVALKGKFTDGHFFLKEAANNGARFALIDENYKTTILKEKIPKHLTLLFVPNPLQAMQELAASYRKNQNCQVISLIGTHGKTLVKDLLKTLLKSTFSVVASPESFNSQIGVPLSLFKIQKHHQIALIEAAISKPNEMDTLVKMIQPTHCILTHFGEKHLTTLPSEQLHLQELKKMLISVPSSGWILLPSLEKALEKLHHSTYLSDQKCKTLPFATFSWGGAPSLKVSFPDEASLKKEIKTGFSYLQRVINTGVKAAKLLGVSSKKIKAALKDYEVEPLRKELWKTTGGALIINDSYAEDPSSIDLALRHFQTLSPLGRRIFVFGGLHQDKTLSKASFQSFYLKIALSLSRQPIDHLILVGQGTHLLAFLKDDQKKNLQNVFCFSSYKKTFAFLLNFLKVEDLVLFKGEKKIPLDTLFEIFHGSAASNVLFINLSKIRSNILSLKEILPPKTQIMPIVKGFAYGTDHVLLSKFLKTLDIQILGVSHVEEGVSLKRSGVTQKIFCLHAAPFEAKKAVFWGLEVGVSDFNQIEHLAKEASLQKKTLKVHLHIDTGMNRLGCKPKHALQLAKMIQQSPFLFLEGIMTHFSAADDPSFDSFTLEQIQQFDTVIEKLGQEGIAIPFKHAANTPGATRFKLPQYNMVRVALALLGFANTPKIRPALSLHSKIVGINKAIKGESVSYGRRYLVKKESEKIAILPIGYVDGIQRSFSEKSSVLIHGKKAPMIGKVNMDFMMVDITDIPEAKVGDSVLIFGEDEFGRSLSLDTFASKFDSVTQDVLSCLGPRIQRIFIDED